MIPHAEGSERGKSFLGLFFRKEKRLLFEKRSKNFCSWVPRTVLIGYLLALLACAAPHGAVPTDALIPPTLAFTLRDGTVLPARAWLPTRPRGVILALHGFLDSRDAWELPAPVFAAAGYAVYAPDQRGFGATATRGTWPGTDTLVSDAADLVQQLRARYAGLPVIVMGESMGGAVALLLAARPAPSADAFVLLAPAVWGWHQLPPPYAITLRLTALLAPAWSPDPGRVAQNIYASDNITALIRLGRDPLTIRTPSIALTKGLVDLMTAAQAAAPDIHGRVLVLSGRRDQLVPPAATEAAWAHFPANVRRAFYPHGYHLLLRDTDRALVEADILAWLSAPDAWLPSGADAATAAWQADHAWHPTTNPYLPATEADTTFAPPIWPY
jgi:alpha-beta hydrolase superfamily lysophospholipase